MLWAQEHSKAMFGPKKWTLLSWLRERTKVSMLLRAEYYCCPHAMPVMARFQISTLIANEQLGERFLFWAWFAHRRQTIRTWWLLMCVNKTNECTEMRFTTQFVRKCNERITLFDITNVHLKKNPENFLFMTIFSIRFLNANPAA